MQMTKCKVCGGTVNIFGKHISCNYCGQIYDVGGSIVSDDEIYREAIKKQNQGTLEGIEEAKKMFESIPTYKDSAMRTIDSYKAIDNIKVAAEEKKLEEERKYLLQLEENKKIEIKKRRIKKFSFGIVSIAIVVVAIFCVNSSKQKKEMKQKYNNAMELYDNQQYQEAKEAFEALDGYSDSEKYVDIVVEKLEECKSIYNKAKKLYDSGKYEDAIKEFSTINMYLDSLQYIDNCASNLMIEAENMLGEKEFESAKYLINNIPAVSNKYEDGQLFLEKIEDEIMNSKYNEVIKLFNTQQYEIAKESFIALDGYKDSADYIKKIEEIIIKNKYNSAINLYNNGKLIEAQGVFMSLKGYEDSMEYINEIGNKLYEQALTYCNQRQYVDSANIIEKIDTLEEWKDYTKAITLFDCVKSEYKMYVENESILILHNNGYNNFLSFVRSKENNLYSKTEADDLIGKYKPIHLMNIDTYAESGYIHIGTDYYSERYKDNLGNTYSWGMNRCVVNFEFERSYMEYKVTEFNFLSGTLILNYDLRSNTEEGYMRVYGDGVLLYTSPAICKGFEPLFINIDISEVDIIRFEFDGEFDNVSFIEPSLLK